MTAGRRVSDSERRARLWRRHHLAAGTLASDPAAVAVDLVGLHATDPTGVYLGARARVAEFNREMLERALYEERTLVRMLGMRRTLFVVETDGVPILYAAAARDIARRERPRLLAILEGAGIGGSTPAERERWLVAVEDATVAAIEARGEAAAAELTRVVPDLGLRIPFGEGKPWAGMVGVSTRVLFLLSMEGRIVRARPRGTWLSSQYRWTSASRWLPPDVLSAMATLTSEEAQARLIERWLRAFGPGTLDDIRWWTGFPLGVVRSALASIETVEVDLDGGASGLVLADDADAPTGIDAPSGIDPDEVALLPALDTSIMGWKARDWYLGPRGTDLFDRAGNAGPSIWRAGRVIGGWSQRRDGSIPYRLFEDVGTQISRRIEAEIDLLRDWLGDYRITPRFRTPIEAVLVD